MSKSEKNKKSKRLDKDGNINSKSSESEMYPIGRLEILQEIGNGGMTSPLSRRMQRMLDAQNKMLGNYPMMRSLEQSLQKYDEIVNSGAVSSVTRSTQKMLDAQNQMLENHPMMRSLEQSLKRFDEIMSSGIAGSISSSVQRMMNVQDEILRNSSLMSSLDQSLNNQQEILKKSAIASLTRSMEKIENVYPKFLSNSFSPFEAINTNELERVLENHKSIIGNNFWEYISDFFKNLDYERREFSKDSLDKINAVLREDLKENEEDFTYDNESEKFKNFILYVIEHFDRATMLQVLFIIIHLCTWYSNSQNNKSVELQLEDMSTNIEILVDEMVKSNENIKGLINKNQKGRLLKTTKKAIIRKEPTSKSESIDTIDKGEIIELLESGNRWNLIFTFDENDELSKIGWIYKGNTIKVEN